ncbi:hypothetical protein [Nocardia wallacei]|uniref:hypothetical protein n=1 Tax=Nocardia wallacei TaxID=480035 RepID=UPI002457450C|nr:hypothetical protein [Nocardia wallacei]
MTNSLPEVLVVAVISFIAGVVVGQFIRFRRVHARGRAVLVPQLDPKPFDGRVFRLVVVALFLASTALIVQFTYHQRGCNAEFQSTSLELRRIGAEDRALEAQDDELRNQRDDAMKALIETLVTPPPPGQRVDALGALNHYRAVTEAIDVRRDQLVEARANLEQQRREQPAPKERC